PVFETTLKSFAVSKDADAKFTCIVIGYPPPEVTWYRDNEEMDRYCGLPKYEILRHGNRHTLQLYKCQEEDAAIYQASAKNNKGIVSCSGVLEVGTMTEYKIHQRWFAKLKKNAEAKLYEIEQSRKLGKENVEIEQLRRVSPDRFQRKRRLTGEVGMRSGTSLWDKEEVAKVRIPDGKACFGEDENAKNREASLTAPTLFPNDFLAGHLETEVATTNGDSSLESGEENGERNDHGFLQYIYETVGIVTKEFSAKKKKKEEDKAAPSNASQEASQLEDGMQPRRKVSMQKEDGPAILSPKVASPIMYYDAGAKPKAEKKVLEGKARAMEKALPTRDFSNMEDTLPTTVQALRRAKAEEERNETQARQKSKGMEIKHGETETPGTDQKSNPQQFQHPSQAVEPTTEILIGHKVECLIGSLPLFAGGEVLLIRETDLLDSALPETQPELQLPEAGPVDLTLPLQGARQALTPVRDKEKDTIASDILSRDNSRPPEAVVEENLSLEKDQNTDLVSSLKNYLLLLLKITSESDKSKARSPKPEAKMMEEKTPLSAIPKHLPDVGIAGLTPRTSRKIFEQVQTDQLFQSAENLQLTPRTSRKLTGMINQELLACQKNLNIEPETPPLPCVPSIVVGGEPAGLPHLPSSGIVSDTPTALPSATPEELASGARRKIFLPKTKTAEEMEEGALESQLWPKRDSPSVSPQQGRKSQALLQTSAPGSPVEKRSPNFARKMATLEVPKMCQEMAGESKKDNDSSPLVPEDVEESVPKVGESRKTNDPFKAPQVVRKIRGEQFSDASGNLKLWCQFFNILSDSKLIWYKDEVPMAEVKRSSGDEGQAALAIVQMSLKDCGVYQCTIQNEYGTDSTDFLLSSEVLSGFIAKEEIEAGEEIEMTPMVFAKGLADSGFWGDKLFGRIMVEDLEVGQGFLRKACRARAIYGLEPVFESGHTGIIKVQNLIAFGGRSENTLVERNYDITIQECKIQNSSREYCKIFAAETRVIVDFGSVPEIIPLYLIYRPANNIPYATMEEDLPGLFQCYCGRESDGNRLAPPNRSEIGQKCSAFQHWLYQWTNGNILVTDLEGEALVWTTRLHCLTFRRRPCGKQKYRTCRNGPIFQPPKAAEASLEPPRGRKWPQMSQRSAGTCVHAQYR
uniref:non-specific serine/threonine protein kinase n=1 Tax=Laticauda laticaudata TaxID=8630 RepID=A0A8C5SUB1_LATLA